MILTFKQKHNKDFSSELSKAKEIANFAINNRRKLSSKHVRHIGLKSAISNQILRKYGKNKKAKKVSNIKLTIPNQSIKLNKKNKSIDIPCLKLKFNYQFKKDFNKVNQIEIDNKYFYVAVQIPENETRNIIGFVGIDLNANEHCAVIASPITNKVMMLGKKCKHIHHKYKNIRRKLQKRKKYTKLKTIKRRESHIIRDLNHKMSHKIVEYCKEHNLGIKMEKLSGIRKNRKQKKSFKYTLHSWSYYQLQLFVEYKAKLLGVPVFYIDPAYTSQTCSRCKQRGKRNNKKFKCPHCGHTCHADVNAAFNIAFSSKLLTEPESTITNSDECLMGVDLQLNKIVSDQRLSREKDLDKGNTDVPQRAIAQTQLTLEPPLL